MFTGANLKNKVSKYKKSTFQEKMDTFYTIFVHFL